MTRLVAQLRPADPTRRILLVGCAIVLAGCGDSPAAPPAGELVLAVEPVAAGLASPAHLAAPLGDSRLFVVEQPGRIRIFSDGQLRTSPFLDITTQVRSGGEQGLLSVAFHPQYPVNGRFFVNYTDLTGTTRVVEYTVSTDPDVADPTSARLIIEIPQPFGNHNGGQLAFGPDGMLYIGMGDGGSGGDPLGHGQNRSTLLGALLRIDIDGDAPYTVPPDNPYVGADDARPEVWAIGLRNPWRFSFDFHDDHIYIADVGQNRREEVNVQPAGTPGLNYGWNRMEGSLCYPPGTTCAPSGLVLPAVEYANPGAGCSVTGGHVYRGAAIPELHGHYVYADYCRGWVRSFRYTGAGNVADEREWPLGDLGRIASFGEDAAGELYIVSHDGVVYRILRTELE